jgi:hypothetical protein
MVVVVEVSDTLEEDLLHTAFHTPFHQVVAAASFERPPWALAAAIVVVVVFSSRKLLVR